MKKTDFPQIKKELKAFLSSEEGKIIEKNAIKFGITLAAITGAMNGLIKPGDANANCTHTSHGSHGSHGSHSVGGWC